jgi:hypothetical protein
MQTVGKKSIVSKATTTSASLRATIPEDIVKELSLQVGDALDWETLTDKGKKYARIRKLE